MTESAASEKHSFSESFLAALLADTTTDRQQKLEAWLSYHRIYKNRLAVDLGVHPSMISRIIKGDRAPKERIQQLVELGIPEQLLPAPSRPPGRPKGSTKRKSSSLHK
ncbi:helix-turn-helix domain-containing protein [Megalodesulfovibrio gigas]|uniref:Putative transcription regulator containing HTH domain protein n=1 Tax=Megalodesulfovibrio gigas (strain ATCC 19364 / DSM 1382 / NCIMB 9332 / VKM B-1759) TaxID=1121448 RepID=T2GBB0_MEGG1|nr:helix-turn-helix transcriptional regulator [Megalodesulfovibrio gigas]AGW13421.1 putative transcription regulator containing HTH domain protein [Megalodesulfovibrio gigas DSM 1382 = ATCC 19364]